MGAGIVGASIAYNLSLLDADVTVVDASSPGMAASHASYAWINARPKLPRSYHDLNCRSMDVWSRWERRLGGDVGVAWGGELRWTATEDGASELRQEVALMQSWGYPIRMISPEELREMEPGLVADPSSSSPLGIHKERSNTSRLGKYESFQSRRHTASKSVLQRRHSGTLRNGHGGGKVWANVTS
jgi:glycine/D-amino acid oxidase-like deaminating enzyme